MYRIFKNIDYQILHEGKNFVIDGIEYDSRKIKDNFVFICMIGSVTDGHNFIQNAIDKGAKLIVVEKEINYENYNHYKSITFVFVENLRKKLGFIASNYYNYPQNKLKIIGITGTNGKTTSSYILENILENTARIGTTGHRILNEEFSTENTTPESLELVKLFDEAVKRNVKYFIMEVSSHALEIGRVNMLTFDSVIFTNLTQDHLDFHGTMDKYFEAKKSIFSMLKEDKKGVVNSDDIYGVKIIDEYCKNVYSIGVNNLDKDINGEIIEYNNCGMKIKIYGKLLHNEEYFLNVNLVGEYNLYNILGCVTVALNLGYDMKYIINKLENMKPVPGRFELIKNNKGAKIVVDYAHTDDGLLNIGKTLKNITIGRVVTLFGAGGDRDPFKRPKMARAAAKFSDFIIITSDNPRTENPKKILEDVEKGLIEIKYSKEKYVIIEDREKAIKFAIDIVKEDDSLLIAGKGHETYQIIGNEKKHFDDREVAKKYLNEGVIQ